MTVSLEANMPLRLLAAFQQSFPELTPQRCVQTPGREMWAAGTVTDSGQIAVAAPDHEGFAVFTRQSAKSRRTVMQRPLPHWARYPAGIAVLLDNCGLHLPGLAVVLTGDEPPGPRYDYAFAMAFAALWHDLSSGACPETGSLVALVDQVRRQYVDAG